MNYYDVFRKALAVLAEPTSTDEHRRQVEAELLDIAMNIDRHCRRPRPPIFGEPDRLEAVVSEEQTYYGG